MAVMASSLSNFVPAQQRSEQHQQNAAQKRIREEELPNDLHGGT
jgi:hypothetical protein